jgi:hypothetical protein
MRSIRTRMKMRRGHSRCEPLGYNDLLIILKTGHYDTRRYRRLPIPSRHSVGDQPLKIRIT